MICLISQAGNLCHPLLWILDCRFRWNDINGPGMRREWKYFAPKLWILRVRTLPSFLFSPRFFEPDMQIDGPQFGLQGNHENLGGRRRHRDVLRTD